jgi:hypothetical protein
MRFDAASAATDATRRIIMQARAAAHSKHIVVTIGDRPCLLEAILVSPGMQAGEFRKVGPTPDKFQQAMAEPRLLEKGRQRLGGEHQACPSCNIAFLGSEEDEA